MCKYCDCVDIPMAGKYGNGIESIESESVFAHIQQTPDNKFLFGIDEDVFYHFEINYCPMCGRDLSYKSEVK